MNVSTCWWIAPSPKRRRWRRPRRQRRRSLNVTDGDGGAVDDACTDTVAEGVAVAAGDVLAAS